MKTLLALAIAAVLTVGAYAQARPESGGKAADTPPGKLGDFWWDGKNYRDASARTSGGMIVISSAKDGAVVIPMFAAPASLKARLGIVSAAQPEAAKPVAAATPQPQAAPEFMILGATEAQLVEKYGAAKMRARTEPIAPATKSLVFDAGEVTVRTEIWQGKCGCFVITKKQGKMTPDDYEHSLLRAGGTWLRLPKSPETLRRADGGLAVESGTSFRAETGGFYKVRTGID